MKLPRDFMPEFGSLTGLLIDMAHQQTMKALLNMIVDRMSQRPAEGLVEIWLKTIGDQCSSCPNSESCGGKGRACFHRKAFAYNQGYPVPRVLHRNTMLGRIPENHGVIGQICRTGQQVVLREIKNYKNFLPHHSGLSEAGIVSFIGQPLINKNEIIGVIAYYLTMKPVDQGIEWSRVIANYTAFAITNTKALEKVEKLKKKVQNQYESFREEVIGGSSFGNIIGQSNGIYQVIKMIGQVAPTHAPVLIQGESGTGKELVAEEIHKRSLRRHLPFVKKNCASIPIGLWESELFGHLKGAFTGALKDRAGYFQVADKGSLFLDEIGEIPLEQQGKLLRVLQDGTYQKVGGEKACKADVRIIAATNRNLNQMTANKQFRTDLFYRLNVFPIKIPPLRERKDDIPLLSRYFLNKICKKMNRTLPRISTDYIKSLQEYNWPGNVRELQNVIQRAVITGQLEKLNFSEHNNPLPTPSRTIPAESIAEVIPEVEMKKLIRENIRNALMHSNGKIYGSGGAAELLGIKPTTLRARIKKYDLQPSVIFS